jgi:hypothetical protein
MDIRGGLVLSQLRKTKKGAKMKKTMGFIQAGWRMLAYDTLVGDGEKMIERARSAIPQSSAGSANFIWILRKEHAESSDDDVGTDDRAEAFKEGRCWACGLIYAKLLDYETESQAAIRMALTWEGVNDIEHWTVEKLGPKMFAVKQMSPGMIAAQEAEELYWMFGASPLPEAPRARI